jgi:hypothetical protein
MILISFKKESLVAKPGIFLAHPDLPEGKEPSTQGPLFEDAEK